MWGLGIWGLVINVRDLGIWGRGIAGSEVVEGVGCKVHGIRVI